MTTYSRAKTHHERKARRRGKTKLLLAVNGFLLVCIAFAAFAIWKANEGGTGEASPPSGSQAPSGAAGTNKPGTEEPDSGPSAAATDDGDADGTALPSQEASSEPSGEPGNDGEGDRVSLAFVGDILPAARVLELMKSNGYDYPFREAKALLEAADIAAGNLETPITVRGTPAEDKQFVFRGTVEALDAVKDAGFDFLSLANNHTLDYGWQGLSDTMDALDDAGLKHAGSGNDDKEAFEPSYIEVNGTSVAFISVTRVVPVVEWKADRNVPGVAEAYSPTRAVAAIEEAKKNADIVVVMAHWGEERNDKQVPHQTDLAHRFVDAGADLVIGSHPHVLQGFESYKGKWIAYSLGNFVFSTTSVRSSETGILNAKCGKDGDCSLSFTPMFATNSQPAPMEDAEGKDLLARLSALSIGASVGEDGAIVARN
ncbi:CapA family protein [Cohnella cellulosilytica]|uniref:CapA family protein n=1 Tax=Cohnella cellulosilytica TaxID=986710 RepID=A0ABW2FAS9_9BACL